MTIVLQPRRWAGPSLFLQVLGLLLGGLVVAQLVTLLLTVLLPPGPPPQHSLAAVAAALQGSPTGENRPDRLERQLQSGPPDLSRAGWLVSPRAQYDLARMLGAARGDVRVAFYSPLPFAGTPGSPRLSDARVALASVQLAGRLLQGPLGGGRMPPSGPPGEMSPPGGFPRPSFPTPGASPPSMPRPQPPAPQPLKRPWRIQTRLNRRPAARASTSLAVAVLARMAIASAPAASSAAARSSGPARRDAGSWSACLVRHSKTELWLVSPPGATATSA